MIPSSAQWIRGLATAFGAWLVIATGLWILRGPTTGDAIATAVVSTLLVAFVVSWIARRLESAAGHWPVLMGVHALVALLFGSLMVAQTHWVQATVEGTTLRDSMGGARFLGAEFLFWAWLYAVLATGAHGLRIREDLRAERERTARSEADLAEARLTALRGQLNPHFLFNALHTVSALVSQDAGRASEAIARLGSLLRYAIDEADARTVDLEDELEFTRSYLDLTRLGMGDRLRVDWRVDPSASSRIPPFVLQTLVENAVRHGIQPLPDGGDLRIEVAANDPGLRLTVENDAPRSTDDPDGSDGRTGFGLANLRSRLETLYAGAATLRTGSGPDGRFTATVEVPE